MITINQTCSSGCFPRSQLQVSGVTTRAGYAADGSIRSFTYHFHRSIKSYSTVNHPNTTSSGRIKACIDFLSARRWSMKSPINLLGSTWMRPPPSALHGIVCSGAGTMLLYQSSANMCSEERISFSQQCVCGCVCVVLVMLCNLRCCSAADGGRRCRSASAINLKHPDLSGREERRISDFILCDVKLHCAAHVHCQCVQDEDGITLWKKPFKSFPSDVCVV